MRNEIEFRVSRCDNSKLKSGEPRCASDSEIDEFLYDFVISSWIIYEQMDYEIYGSKPVFKQMELMDRYLVMNNKQI